MAAPPAYRVAPGVPKTSPAVVIGSSTMACYTAPLPGSVPQRQMRSMVPMHGGILSASASSVGSSPVKAPSTRSTPGRTLSTHVGPPVRVGAQPIAGHAYYPGGIVKTTMPMPFVAGSFPPGAVPMSLASMFGGVQQPMVPSDAVWCYELLKMLWPHLCKFLGDMLKDMIRKLMLKMDEKVPLELYAEVDKMAARLAQHPFTFPIRISWIDAILSDVWKLLRPVLEVVVKKDLVPKIKEKLPSFLSGVNIDPFTIGHVPPHITNARTTKLKRDTTDGAIDVVHLILDLSWISDLNIGLTGPPHGKLSLGVKSVSIKTELNIVLSGFIDKPPFISAVSMYLNNPLDFKLDWTGMLDFLDMDMFDDLLHKKVHEAVAKSMILPNRIAMMLDKTQDVLRFARPPPRGLLKLRMLKAKGLRGSDAGLKTLFTGERTCDPYVSTLFGAEEEWNTEPIKKASGEASWEEAVHYYLVDEPCEQHFDFLIIDHNLMKNQMLARKKQVDLFTLLFGNDMKARSLQEREQIMQHMHTRRCEMRMDTMWPQKLKAEKEAERPVVEGVPVAEKSAAHLEGESDDDGDQPHGFMDRLKGLANWVSKEAHEVADKVEHAWEKHTHITEEDLKKLVTTLELEANWWPIELNPAVARSVKSGAEKITTVFFVGIYAVHNMPHPENDPKADESTKYYIQVECTPCVSFDGEVVDEIEEDAKTSPARRVTSHKKKPKKKAKPQAGAGLATDEEKRQDLQRKIVKLISAGVPTETVADVLDLQPQQVNKYLSQAIDDHTELIELTFNNGFEFLLEDPRSSNVKVEVFRTVGKHDPESLGHVLYHSSKLLARNDLTEKMQHVPLQSGQYPGVSISMKYQLRTIQVAGFPKPPPGFAQRGLPFGQQGSMPGQTPVKGQRMEFVDRLGRKKVQIDGIWVDDEELKAPVQDFANAPSSRRKGAARNSQGSQAPNAAGAPGAPGSPEPHKDSSVKEVAKSAVHAVESGLHKAAEMLHIGSHHEESSAAAPGVQGAAACGQVTRQLAVPAAAANSAAGAPPKEGMVSHGLHAAAEMLHLGSHTESSAAPAATATSPAAGSPPEEGMVSHGLHAAAEMLHLGNHSNAASNNASAFHEDTAAATQSVGAAHEEHHGGLHSLASAVGSGLHRAADALHIGSHKDSHSSSPEAPSKVGKKVLLVKHPAPAPP